MNKILIFIFLFLMFSACSVDTKTGLWENKLDPVSDKSLSDLRFDKELSYDEYKINIITYGKKSSFPELDK